MKRIVSSFAVASLVSLLAWGCSSSSSSDSAPSAPDACNQLATTYCAKVAACTPFFASLSAGDTATCTQRFASSCMHNLAANGTAETTTMIAACSSAASSVSCPDLYASNFPAACSPVAGQLANGAGCGDSSQCQSAFCGFDSQKAICGVCGVAPAAEAACVNGGCPNGLKCGGDSKCHKPGLLNDACDDNRACDTAFTCLMGKCVNYLKTGDACDPAGTAAPTHAACDITQGLWCNLLSKKCEAIIQNAAQGAKCGVDVMTGSVTLCEPKSYCQVPNAQTFIGTCVARASDGAACDNSKALFAPSGGPCLAQAICLNGVCTVSNATTCK